MNVDDSMRCQTKVDMRYSKFKNVWDALADTPEEALNLTLRSDLMTAIEMAVEGWKVPQGVAAKRLGISRPRPSQMGEGGRSR
jgi:predicted XRE-type DNA-binding protein